MASCPEDEVGLLSSCPNCEKQSIGKPTHRTRVYWIVVGLTHTGLFLLTLLLFNIFANSKSAPKWPVQSSPIDHDKHLVGTFACEFLLTMVKNMDTSADDWSSNEQSCFLQNRSPHSR